MVCADRRVREHFRGGVYWVTIGRDVRDTAALAAKVNDVIRLVAGENAAFADPGLAGQRLGTLLNTGARKLLILDDVWESGQLAPFTDGGNRCVRLVTTRATSLVAGVGAAVPVDQMSPEQSRRLLTYGLPPLDVEVADELLALTGRWPLLLRLVNKILASAANAGQDVSAAGATLAGQLHVAGPVAADNLLGTTSLDVADPGQRTLAVRATIEASTSLLDQQDRQRFTELAVFAQGEAIPFELIAWLWHETAGLAELEASLVCHRLADLGLVTLPPTIPGSGGLVLHDVIRDFLRNELAPGRLAELHETLLNAMVAALRLHVARSPGSSGKDLADVAWWELGDTHGYVPDHLIEHLIDSGRAGDADALASDLRWVGTRLIQFGPAAPVADLSLVGTPRATRLSATLAQVAHLLARTDPSEAVVDVLHSRVANDPYWGAQVARLRDLYRRPHLVSRWPMPDLPDPAFRHALTGRDPRVSTVAIAPDGTWLAAGGSDGTIQVWDTASWAPVTCLTTHGSHVFAMGIAPDGTWLVTGDYDGIVRIWDTASWAQITSLAMRGSTVFAVAIAPDGTWLATATQDGTVRLWDAASWAQKAAISGRRGFAHQMAIAPDGAWLATVSRDTIRIWDTASWARRAILRGASTINGLVIAPDGTWLATGGYGPVRIWDTVSWSEKAAFPANVVHAMSIAPDGAWLAIGGDGPVGIWDTTSWTQKAVLIGHHDDVSEVAISPDSSWLATASEDGTVRIWDTPSRTEDASRADRDVLALAIAPDRTWLAAGGYWTVGIWDIAGGMQKTVLGDYSGGAKALAIAPDGTWLASGGLDGKVRIWDTASWTLKAAFRSHRHPVQALAIAPDGTWLASGSLDESVRIWSTTSVRRAPRILNTSYDWRQAIAIAPDGTWLAAGGQHGTVRIWDTATWTQTATLTSHDRDIKAVTIAPDGSMLATADVHGSLRIWDIASGRVLAMMRVDTAINACAWASSRSLSLGGAAGLYVFDFLHRTDSPFNPLNPFIISPDMKMGIR